MIEGMDAVMKSAGGARVPAEVEARISEVGEKEGSPMFRLRVESPSAIVLAGRASPCAESRYHAAR